ncbi:MAG: hypothetical protein H0S79_21060, partial [Anaerolineaceae bacterium]|nr:hypothetical protein [Anaerolineaceae bacterium]
DLVLISAEWSQLFAEVPQPVVVISDFLSTEEVAARALPVIHELMQAE